MTNLQRGGLALSVLYLIMVAADIPKFNRFSPSFLLWKYKYNVRGPKGETLGIAWAMTAPAWILMAWAIWSQLTFGVPASLFMLLVLFLDELSWLHDDEVQGVSHLQSLLVGFNIAAYMWGGFPFYWVNLLVLLMFSATALAETDEEAQMNVSIANWDGHFKRILKGGAAGALWYVGIPWILKGRFS